MTSSDLKKTMHALMEAAEEKIRALEIRVKYEHPLTDDVSLIWKRIDNETKLWGLVIVTSEETHSWVSATSDLRFLAINALPDFVEGLLAAEVEEVEDAEDAIEHLKVFLEKT